MFQGAIFQPTAQRAPPRRDRREGAARMSDSGEAAFIDAPRDPVLVALHAYWLRKCGGRRMPSRADIDPAEFREHLPHVIMYDVDADGGFRIRLVGEAVVAFIGHNFTGRDAATGLEPDAAATMRSILRAVAEGGTPRFRAGKAWWWREKAYRDFEACFLPLAPDARTVNIIFGGVRFDT
jgi:hypothetical protein